MRLLQPFNLGTLVLRNRIVFPPIATAYGTPDGFVTEQEIAYYEAVAKNCGLVIVEAVCVDAEGRILPKQNWIHEDKFIPGLQKLAQAIQRTGAKAAVQLHHAGIVGYFSGLAKTWGPSKVNYPAWDPTVQDRIQELSTAQVEEIVGRFVDGAQRARSAGFDAVEIHGAHGYLLSQFLSSYTNQRKDKYGGDTTGRMRIYLEIMDGLRKELGPDYPVIFRINADDKIDDAYKYQWMGEVNGVKQSESRILAKELEGRGVTALHISAGNYDDIAWEVQPADLSNGCLVYLAEGIKQEVTVPVITVGRIRDPRMAEQILRENRADLVAIGRSLIADHQFLEKIEQKAYEKVNKCVGCLNSCMELAVFNAKPMECSINYVVGREQEFAVTPAQHQKKIMIVGSGPAGLAAAQFAAARGHRVEIFERAANAGGQWSMAAKLPGKSDFADFTNTMLASLQALETPIHFNTEVTPEKIEEFKPDALVLATGVASLRPNTPGADLRHVYSYEEVLKGSAFVGEKVVVCCYRFCCTTRSYAGCQTASFLAERGCDVTIVSGKENLLDTMILHNSSRLWQRFAKFKVKTLTGLQLERITTEGVMVRQDGVEKLLPADSIILANGLRGNDSLTGKVQGLVPEMYIIGDAVKPRTLRDAVHEGTKLGLEI